MPQSAERELPILLLKLLNWKEIQAKLQRHSNGLRQVFTILDFEMVVKGLPKGYMNLLEARLFESKPCQTVWAILLHYRNIEEEITSGFIMKLL